MVKLIKNTMNVETDIRIVWVPEGAANDGTAKDAPAWVSIPVEMPPYGSSAFRAMRLDIYLRRSFLEQSSYDQIAITVAHELSHIILDSIGHRLHRCEKAVDLTAMLLGFRKLYASASYKENRAGNTKKIQTLGYLSSHEVSQANYLISQEQPHWAWETLNRIVAKGRNWYPNFRRPAPRTLFLLGVGLCVSVGLWFLGGTLQHLLQTWFPTSSGQVEQSPDQTARAPTQMPRATPAPDSAQQIAAVQSRLMQLGYPAGGADGVWGQRSRDALRAFKAANGLTINDSWDDASIATLFSVSAAHAPAPMLSRTKR
jgi:hypothetical protein